MTAIPGSWTVAKLGDCLQLLIDHRGKTPAKLGGVFVDEGVPAISAIHIKKGQIDWSQRERYVTEEMYARWMPEPLRSGDVLMTSEAPLGSLAIVPTDEALVLSQRLFGLRGDPSCLDNRYLRWFLQSPSGREQLTTRSSGSTVTGIRQSELRQLEVPLPPLAQQQKIVSLLEDHLSRLDSAEAGIASSDRRLSALRRSQLAGLCTGTTMCLANLARDSGYGTSERCIADGPGVPVVRIPNVRDGAVDLTDEKRVADPQADVGGYMLSAGDLLIVRTNGSLDLIGRSAVVQDGISAAFASYLIRFRVNEDLVRPAWVQAMLTAPQVRRTIEPLAASSAGQYNLSLAKLNPLEIPVPSLEDQDVGLARLRESDRRANRLQQELARGRNRSVALRRSLLSAAFSGHLTNFAESA